MRRIDGVVSVFGEVSAADSKPWPARESIPLVTVALCFYYK